MSLFRHAPEGLPARLTAPGGRVEPRLPAVANARLVPDEEPDHHVDARVPPCDPVRLAQPARLLRPRDAEASIGRIRLIPVLGDPEVLRPVEPLQLAEQLVDVPERDRSRPGRRLARRLAGMLVVGVVRVDVEARAGPLEAAEEDER